MSLLMAGFWAGASLGADTLPATDKPRNMEERRLALEDRIATRFRQADVDHSGTLTREEFDKGLADMKGRFEDVDANRDQMVDEEELRTWRGRKFEQRRTGAYSVRQGAGAGPAESPAAKP